MAFIDDIQSRDTALFPVIEFEIPEGDILRVSIKPFTLEGNYYSPLLLSSPSIKESIDLENRKYKISTVTLSLSNVEVSGARFSDNKIPFNTGVSIYWVSPSCITLSDCYLAFKGSVRQISHDEKTCSITVEDISQSSLHKDVPVTLLGTGDEILEKYRNKPIPMVYGEVDRSPCVTSGISSDSLVSFDILPDKVRDNNITIEGIQQFANIFWAEGATRTSDLIIHNGDSYCYVLDYPLYSDGFSVNSRQYNLGDTNQYITANPQNFTFESDSPNAIAENIVQAYEVDSTPQNVEKMNLSGTMLWASGGFVDLTIAPVPGFSWENSTYEVGWTSPTSSDPSLQADLTLSMTTLSYLVPDVHEDYLIRNSISFGSNSHIVCPTTLSAGSNKYLELAVSNPNLGETYEPFDGHPTDYIMHTWESDIDISGNDWNGVTTNQKKYISEPSEMYSDEALVWRYQIQPKPTFGTDFASDDYIQGDITTFRANIEALKVYYLDKFANRDFYVHVKGRVS